MKSRLILAMVLPLGLGACGGVMRGGDSNQLGAVKYDYVYSMQVVERHMTISPAGEVEMVQRTGTTEKDVLVAKGTLTPSQKASVIHAFRDWNQLAETYPVFFRGPIIDISYNGHKVEGAGGETAPDRFNKAQGLLKEIGDSIVTASTEPATMKP